MKKIFIAILGLLTLTNCSEEDNSGGNQMALNTDILFYSNNDESANSQDVIGVWSVYSARFENQTIEVPSNFPFCGRDYFIFGSDGDYTEYLYQNESCNPRISNSTWILSKGIIEISSLTGASEEIALESTGDGQLNLKFRLDIDDDGELDILSVIARKYDPIENNHVTKSFERDNMESSLLKFVWRPFTGPGTFDRYEIHRNSGGSCTKEQTELITTIDDSSVNTFVDFTPPSTEENICYFLKVFNDAGLVGESILLKENPKNLVIDATLNLNPPVVGEESIELNWDEFSMPYFSHYEVVYANSDASNSLFHEEATSARIDDIQQNDFLDLDPSYIENPFYSVHAYNIFGTRIESNYQRIDFRRKDLLAPVNLEAIMHDPSESILYLYGKSRIPTGSQYNQQAVLRYNYETNVIEAYTDDESYFGLESTVKLITSDEGKELIAGPQHFFDTTTLSNTFSFGSFYLSEQFGVTIPVGFTYLDSGFWIIMDTEQVFVFKRNGQELNLVDKQTHFDKHHGDLNYRIVDIDSNQFLIGHKSENESVLFKIDGTGKLTDKATVQINLGSEYLPIYRNKNITFTSSSGEFVINQAGKEIYSTNSFEVTEIINQDFYAIGISRDGRHVFGTGNNPDWFGSDVNTQFFKREVLIFDTVSKQVSRATSKGYPLRVFENGFGEIISVSVPENQIPINFEVFVEKITLP